MEQEDSRCVSAMPRLLLTAVTAEPSPAAASAGTKRRLVDSAKSPKVSSGSGTNSMEFDAAPSRPVRAAVAWRAKLLGVLLSRAESSSVAAVGAVTNAGSAELTLLAAALADTVGSGHGGAAAGGGWGDAERGSELGRGLPADEFSSLGRESEWVRQRAWLEPASLAGPSGMVLRSPGGQEERLWPPRPMPSVRRGGGPTGAGSVDARVAAKIARSICSARLGDWAAVAALGPDIAGIGVAAAALAALGAGWLGMLVGGC